MSIIPSEKRHVVIDGSFGEGGGQILRCGLSLSLMLGYSVEFRNIRVNRPKPGLQPQHLTAVHAAAAIGNAQVEGATLGSTRIRFEPSGIKGGEFTLDVEEISGTGSAGSVLLIAQTILLPLSLAKSPSEVTLKGGTHVGWSPSADFVREVHLPALRRIGVQGELEVLTNGFYPRGGGTCVLRVSPATELKPIQWTERGAIRYAKVMITQSELPDDVLRRGAETAETLLGAAGIVPDVETTVRPSRAPGAAVTIAVAGENGFGGFTALGKRGKPIEQVVEEAWDLFLAWARTKTATDPFLADQLVLPLSLVPSESRWTTSSMSGHLKTVLWLMSKFIPVENGLENIENGILVRTRPAPT